MLTNQKIYCWSAFSVWTNLYYNNLDTDNLGLDEFIEEEGVWEDENSDDFEAENLGQDILNDISDGFEDEFDEYIPKIAE